MPDQDFDGVSQSDRGVEHELKELGPLMGRAQEGRLARCDASLALALRTRLVGSNGQPAVTSDRRSGAKRVVSKPRLAIGPAVPALAAAFIIALVLHPFGSQPRVAGNFPQPARSDLLRTYPYLGLKELGAGGGAPSPNLPINQVLPGEAYPTKLKLKGDSFRAAPARLPAYELVAQPLSRHALLAKAHQLGITARQRCITSRGFTPKECARGEWSMVMQIPPPYQFGLHSLAESSVGEVIYHWFPEKPGDRRGSALPRPKAVSAARAWLSQLGWPAARMPVLTPGPAALSGTVESSTISVVFGWARGIRTAAPAATVWVSRSGRVIEAELWPPIARRLPPAAVRSVAEAWTEVMDGTAPIAVDFSRRPNTYPTGSGHVSRVVVVRVLVTPKHGPAYLEPAYRFSGFVDLRGRGRHAWYALVPAAQR